MDTPGLEYLNLINYHYTSFQIVSLSETVKFDIDVVLSNTLNILTFVSHARDMTISRRTIEVLLCTLIDLSLKEFLLKCYTLSGSSSIITWK